MTFQPRYLAYARAHDRTADEMLAHDRVAHPGGCMVGYINWVTGRWAEWRCLRGVAPDVRLSSAQHQDFDAWLQQATP